MAPITLAVVPSSTPGDSKAALAGVCGALTKLLGTTVTAYHPETYSELTAALEKDRVQYAWMSPALVVMTGEHMQLTPLLSAVRGERTDYCSALFVDAASPVTSIEELRGKRIAYVDRTSAAGYLYPRLELASRGVDPPGLFGTELFLHSHAEVVRAVFDGRADVGATYAERPPEGEPVRRAGFLDVVPDRRARVIEWTGPIPNDVIAGHGLLPKTAHRELSNAILTLAERDDGRELLYNAFHCRAFITTPRNTLGPLRDKVRLARMHGLLTHL